MPANSTSRRICSEISNKFSNAANVCRFSFKFADFKTSKFNLTVFATSNNFSSSLVKFVDDVDKSSNSIKSADDVDNFRNSAKIYNLVAKNCPALSNKFSDSIKSADDVDIYNLVAKNCSATSNKSSTANLIANKFSVTDKFKVNAETNLGVLKC